MNISTLVSFLKLPIRRVGKMIVAALALVAVVISGLIGVSVVAPAHADPPLDSQGQVQYRDLPGAGSDTIQDLGNGLGETVKIGNAKVLGSYDAVNPTTQQAGDLIRTRAGGPQFTRPNGSGEGITALKAAQDSATNGQWKGTTLAPQDLAFARSSSAASWTSGGRYAYIPLAEDAVSFAYGTEDADGHDVTPDYPTDLTKDELTAIYSASNGSTVTIDGTQYTVGTWDNANAQIRPFLPQAGSGTRKFWLQTLGLTEDTTGSAVSDHYGSSNTQVEEHDGSVLRDVRNAIAPFSIAQYIAQGNATTLSSAYGVTVNNRRHGAALGAVYADGRTDAEGHAVAPIQPIDVVGGSNVLNTAFPIARPVFIVVDSNDLTSGSELSQVFQGSGALAYTATRPGDSSKKVITDFGFGELGSAGVTIHNPANGQDELYKAGDTTSFRVN